MKFVRLISAVSFSSILFCVGGARAQERDTPPHRDPALPAVAANSPSGIFGAKGQLAISSDAGLSISNTSITGVDGSTTSVQLRPAIDYFIVDNLSLGGFIGLDYTSNPNGHTTTFAIGPRVGYNLAFSERFSVWPKVGFSYSTTSVSQDLNEQQPGPTISRNDSSNALALNLFVPIMFHPVQHFFLGFGPALDTDLTGDPKTTVIAGRLTIGGWL